MGWGLRMVCTAVFQPLLGFLVMCVENYTRVSCLPPPQQSETAQLKAFEG